MPHKELAADTAIDLREYLPQEQDLVTFFDNRNAATMQSNPLAVRWSNTFSTQNNGDMWWRWQFSAWPGQNFYDTVFWSAYDRELDFNEKISKRHPIAHVSSLQTVDYKSNIFNPLSCPSSFDWEEHWWFGTGCNTDGSTCRKTTVHTYGGMKPYQDDQHHWLMTFASIHQATLIPPPPPPAVTSPVAPPESVSDFNHNVVRSSSACVILTQNLAYRSQDARTNGAVSLLQDFLHAKGYLNSQPTGFFGRETFAAVRKFQRQVLATGLDTGFVGSLTRAKIREHTCGEKL